MGATGGERGWWAGRPRRLAAQAPAPHLASGDSVIVPEKSSLGFTYSAKNFHSAPLQGKCRERGGIPSNSVSAEVSFLFRHSRGSPPNRRASTDESAYLAPGFGNE